MTVVLVENNEINDYEYLVEEASDYHDALWLINGIVEQRPVFVYSYEVENLIIGLAKKCDIIIPPINFDVLSESFICILPKSHIV